MSENFTTGFPNLESATPNIDNSVCFDPRKLPASTAAAQLRLMMKEAEGEDKCTLCKAAQELEKPKDSGMSWALPLIFLALICGWGGGFDIDPDGMKAYMDAVEKKRKEKPESKEA